MDLFPYKPRPFQAEAVAIVTSTARDGGHLAFEAPTGTGKTIVLLAGALEACLASGRKVLYVTRTNSQQEQAIREIQKVQGATGKTIRAIALQGRHRLCLKLEDEDDPDVADSSPEDLSHYCGHAKTRTELDATDPKACRHYAGLLQMDATQLDAAVGPDARTAESLKALSRQAGFCSYEANKRLLPQAQIVVAPYIFAFDPGLRQRLLQWWNTQIQDVVLLVDEAHNLPGYLRELHSPRLGKETLRKALSESEALNHPLVGRDMSSRQLIETLAENLDALVAEYAKEEDGFIPPFELEAALLSRFRLTTQGLLQAAHHLANLGDIIKDRRRLLGRVPKSHLSTVATFLRRWIESDEESYVKLAVREPRPYLEAFLVDATQAAGILSEFHATIHTSGTLSPLLEYRDALGLGEGARLERFPSPFPPDRLQIVCASDLTTRYEQIRQDPKLVDRLQEAVRRFVSTAQVSGAVFFPSHQLLEEFNEVGALHAPGRRVWTESRALSQEALMGLVAAHRSNPGTSLLAGVIGGRLSEGLDFPGRQLEAMLIVGVPFPKPTVRQRSLFRYFESRYGKGWEYAVRAPAVRRLRQALGRLIRSPEDRGFAAILDERAAGLLQAEGIAADSMPAEALLEAFSRWQTPLPATTTVK